jgi:Protein of unknown function (DUF3631)
MPTEKTTHAASSPLLKAFLSHFPTVKQKGSAWAVPCPAHNDNHPSLEVTVKPSGKVVYKCQAGCVQAAVTAALKSVYGITAKELSPEKPSKVFEVAVYTYHDLDGTPLRQVVRLSDKSFPQRRYDGQGEWIWGVKGVKRTIYRWPELQGHARVFVVEGEKDADRLWSLDLPATCNVGGANKWTTSDSAQLRAVNVTEIVIFADNDEAGHAHAGHAQTTCTAAHARIVALPGLPLKGDFSDWLNSGRTKEELLALVDAQTGTTLDTAPVDAPPDTPLPVLSDLLDALRQIIRKYVVLTKEQVTLLALWVAHTHVLAAFDCTPYLQITSGTKRAGKSRLLEVLEPLVARPWYTARATAAVLVRKVDAEQPTLLLDESDASFNGPSEYSEALRGVLNAGYRVRGKTSLCVGQGAKMTYKDFNTFSAKAIAGIGRLPETVADRAVPIKLKRKIAAESCARWYDRAGWADATPLHRQLVQWAAQPEVIETLRQARPAMPAPLDDRKVDVLEPLVAIADLAGEAWSKAVQTAAVAVAGAAEETDLAVELLRDVRDVLAGVPDAETGVPVTEAAISTKVLLTKLTSLEDRPWGTWGKPPKPLTPHALARLLGPLDIHSKHSTPGMAIGGTRSRTHVSGTSPLRKRRNLPLPPVPKLHSFTTAITTALNCLFRKLHPRMPVKLCKASLLQ